MYHLRLPQTLLVALALYACTGVFAAPMSSGTDRGIERRTPKKLYHVTSAASAENIKTGGPKLQVKTKPPGDDFNPINTGGFYMADNLQDITEWCKGRTMGDPKTDCASVVTYDFDPAGLKIHTFKGPGGRDEAQLMDWLDTDDFNQWSEFVSFCTHNARNDEDVVLPADLADQGKTLDVVIGPLQDHFHITQYTFRTTKGLQALKNVHVEAAK